MKTGGYAGLHLPLDSLRGAHATPPATRFDRQNQPSSKYDVDPATGAPPTIQFLQTLSSTCLGFAPRRRRANPKHVVHGFEQCFFKAITHRTDAAFPFYEMF